jgi:uncharacterized protein related to proFAR isomerase
MWLTLFLGHYSESWRASFVSKVGESSNEVILREGGVGYQQDARLCYHTMGISYWVMRRVF